MKHSSDYRIRTCMRPHCATRGVVGCDVVEYDNGFVQCCACADREAAAFARAGGRPPSFAALDYTADPCCADRTWHHHEQWCPTCDGIA